MRFGVVGAGAIVAVLACEATPQATPPVSGSPSATTTTLAERPDAGRLEADWNDGEVAWRPYADGIAEAARTRKPICLVFFTTWCPHCKRYSHLFKDPRVVAAARDFVMIRVDRDLWSELSKRYSIDGEYIPRTFFLSADGRVDPAIHAERPTYAFFYDELDPAPLLAAMVTARAAFARDGG